MVDLGGRVTTGAVLALMAAGLSGCAAMDPTGGAEANAQPPARMSVQPPVYCYRTLGAVNCYSQPLPASEANRLVGYQGPAPRSTSGTGPLSP